MPIPTLYIFVSSTWEDLRPERKAARETIDKLYPFKSVGMEDFGSRDESTLHISLDWARRSDAYVGIIAGRYGSGITEKEYEAAREAGKPCFIYFKSEGADPLEVDAEPEKRLVLAAFKEKLRGNHTCTESATVADLRSNLSNDLSNWKWREFSDGVWQEAGLNSAAGSGPHQLPPPPFNFVGRAREIEELLTALGPNGAAPVACINGTGGVGKTALALAAADRLRDSYPDAQLFVQLGGSREDPVDRAESVARCLESLGVERPNLPVSLDERAKQYRHALSGMRALIVLDDAADESQVAPFVPPRGCALIVTSRGKLVVQGVTPIHLNPLPPPEARALLLGSTSRITPGYAEQIARLCGHLPLALHAAGSLLAVRDDLPPADLLSQLRDERTILKTLDRAGKALEIGVEATLSTSYKRLGAEARRVFRQLAVFPASFDKAAEEAICQDVANEQLSDLALLNLVFYDQRTRRYLLHELVRVYARQLLDPREVGAAGLRHAEHFFHVARRIEALYAYRDTTARALETFDVEWENLCSALAWLAGNQADGDEGLATLCVQYVDALKDMLYLRRPPAEQVRWLETALSASQRLKRRDMEGRCLCHLGNAYSTTQPEVAEWCYHRALELACENRDRLGEGKVLGGLGNFYARTGRASLAVEHYVRCWPILYDIGDWQGVGHTLTNLGVLYSRLGNSADAVKTYGQALEVAQELNDRPGEATALSNLGTEYLESEDVTTATEFYQRALSVADEAGDLRSRATALTGLGHSYAAAGNHRSAADHHRQALAASREIGDLSIEGVALGNLGNESAQMGEFGKALRLHRRALGISRKLGDSRGEIQDLLNLGNAHYLSGNIRRALRYHSKALTLSREAGDPLHQALSLWNIAQACASGKEHDAAGTHAEAALEIFDQLAHPLCVEVRDFLARSPRKQRPDDSTE